MPELLPRQGDAADLFDRLRDYVAPHDAELFARCAGATDVQLNAYARTTGFGDLDAVPASYRSFVRGMGADDGGLFAVDGIDARVDEVIGLYEDLRAAGPDSLNPRLPVAALYTLGDQISFDRRVAGDDLPLADTADGEWFGPRAESWESLVMQTAVLYVDSRRRHGTWYASSQRSAAVALGAANPTAVRNAVDAFASQHGMSAAWPSDAQRRIFIGDRCSLFARVSDDASATLRVFSDDTGFVRAVADRLAPLVGANAVGELHLIDGHLRA